MWEIITSQGHRARDIQHESDAFRAVHSLGLTTLIAPYRYWLPIIGATDSSQRFIANRQQRRSARRCRATLSVSLCSRKCRDAGHG